jgi:secreted trypsin-like serine protease
LEINRPGGIKVTRHFSLPSKLKVGNYRLLATALTLVFLATVNSVSASPTQGSTDSSPRIIGGTDTTVEKWPSAVFIAFYQDNKLSSFCGGNLIASNWVLTAAHCLVDGSGNYRQASDIRIVLDTTDLTSSSVEPKGITNVIVHPDYISTTKRSDIALLELTNHSEQPIMALYSGKPDVGTEATVIGWGVTSYDDQNNPQYGFDNLLEVDVPVVSNEACNRPESYAGTIIDSQICAGFAQGGKDSCQGDSGGPLIIMQDGSYKQVGIVSYGGGCAQPNKYGVYTHTSSFKTWVEDYTGPLGDSEFILQ